MPNLSDSSRLRAGLTYRIMPAVFRFAVPLCLLAVLGSARSAAEGERITGVRPFYVTRWASDGTPAETTVLYPIFYYRRYGDTAAWSVFNLINHSGSVRGAVSPSQATDEAFDVWPFYFSRVTADPSNSYRAFFPIGGEVLNRFGCDSIRWALWPLYVRSQKHGVITTSTPWPIVRSTTGAASGFSLWPLFGRIDGPGTMTREFYLWPLGWNNSLPPPWDSPPGAAPTRQSGFLPFYSAERGAGFRNETYLWPFFGFTDRSVPYRYHETRYLWPLLVQGRGPDRLVNRWGPIYTHSLVKGVDKTWVIWPLWRRANWSEGDIAQTQTQFFYFLYWSLVQRSSTRPNAPSAQKVHLWPLLSYWDNGAGRRQWQVLSPFEVFFPHNDEVRQVWSPLFAFFRSDQRAPGDVRSSILWGAVSWEQRERNGSAWRLFGMEFPRKARTVSAANLAKK